MDNNMNTKAMEEENVVEVNDNVLTEDQVHEVYQSLQEKTEDNSNDLLTAAEQETENSEYTELEDITPEQMQKAQEELDKMTIQEEVLSGVIKGLNLGLSNDSIRNTIDVIVKYRQNKNINIYPLLDSEFKKIIDIDRMNANKYRPKNQPVGREFICKMYFDSIVNDAQFEQIFNDFNTEVDAAYANFNTEITSVFNDAYKEAFDSIESLRETDPEKAEKLENIKLAFEDAKAYNRLYDWIDLNNNRQRKKIYKGAEFKYNNEISYFNSKVKDLPVKIPNVEKLYDVIKLYDPDKNKLEIKRFIIALINYIEELDLENISNLAYAYKSVDNIYRYYIVPTLMQEDEAKELFSNIMKVIDKINSFQGGTA